MLTTKPRDPLEILVDASSTTVIVGPGTVQLGTYVTRFDGSRVPYSHMTELSGTSFSGYYQLAVLALSYYDGAVDMTCHDSTKALSAGSLAYPSLTDATSRAVGAFTFMNTDGTVSITSYSKVV